MNDSMTCSLSRLMGKRVSITDRDRKYLQARGQHVTYGAAAYSSRCMVAQVRLLCPPSAGVLPSTVAVSDHTVQASLLCLQNAKPAHF